jgi:hypothetical protein
MAGPDELLRRLPSMVATGRGQYRRPLFRESGGDRAPDASRRTRDERHTT